MGSYEHTQLVRRLKELDDQPRESDQYREWLHASDHLGFVAGNLPPQEIVVYGCGQYSYVHGTIATEAELATYDEGRLYNWGGGPDLCIASYVWGGGRDEVWIERLNGPDHSDSDGDSGHLLFDLSFEGWEGNGRRYIELSQEYAHLTESHWRPEHSAYCRFDANGDIERVASITLASGASEDVTCVSFLWEPLEEYLAANNAVLIRRFDFTLFSPGKFEMWSDRPEERVPNERGLRYRQKVDDSASYTMGVDNPNDQRS
ncbi:MAG: hypothetical protein MI724_06110 [Spirochaetales bacterium]|nr:hypothetical protein [Spirochaetales bacterium]